jgi:glycosyltransferase involved in cell wall biosynthesis
LIKGKKLYATWHEVWGKNYWTKYLGGVSGILGHFVETMALYMPDVIISNSENTTIRLRKEGYKKEINTIPLGVDLKGIYNAAPASDPSDLIYVGRLISHKNVDMLIRAIAIAKRTRDDISCKIVGSGPEKTSLQKLVENMGLTSNIQFVSAPNNLHLYGLMKAAKMLVLPSVREGFGLVVIEANAAGLPVITTSHEDNAAKDLIENGVNGLVVEATEQGLANGILQTFDELNLMKPKNNIEKYDWRLVMKKVRLAIF